MNNLAVSLTIALFLAAISFLFFNETPINHGFIIAALIVFLPFILLIYFVLFNVARLTLLPTLFILGHKKAYTEIMDKLRIDF